MIQLVFAFILAGFFRLIPLRQMISLLGSEEENL
jgi:hypothetical protein